MSKSDLPVASDPQDRAVVPQPPAARRLERLLTGPIAPMLARLAAPNVAVATALTLVTIADAWFVGQVGTLALASLALVFPLQALMQMMSAGAMGGGVSSAVARALGAARPDRAQAVLLHALVIAVAMALLYVVIGAGFARPLFTLLGARGAVLEGAVDYAQIAFGGAVAMWLANTFASTLRGTGDMATPAVVLIATSAIQIGLSGALTLGWGPFPALGLRGPAVALVAAFSLAALTLWASLALGQAGFRPRLRGLPLQSELFRDILKVGAIACGNAFLTIATVLIVTRLVAAQGPAALAGYGLGSRLELMLVPLAFGVGGALTASVGANFGAKHYVRARRIAWAGGLFTGVVAAVVGVTAALWPSLWLSLFTTDPSAYAAGALYLAIVGPFYGFFGLGMALYFASQGTGRMVWPLSAGVLRFAVTAGGGALAVGVFAAGTTVVFVLVAVGLVCFGSLLAASLFSSVWRSS